MARLARQQSKVFSRLELVFLTGLGLSLFILSNGLIYPLHALLFSVATFHSAGPHPHPE